MILTPVQLETLRFIRDYVAEHGYAPSFVDMTKHWRIQKAAVFDRLRVLESKGLIARVPKLARSVHLTPLGYDELTL